MKSTIAFVSTALLLALGAANGAVTFTVANYAGSSKVGNGLLIVDGSAAPVASDYATLGYFTGTFPTTGTWTAAQMLSSFTLISTTGVGIGATAGLFNGQAYSDATNVYPTGFQGKQAYMVVGNTSNVASSTAIAIFTLGTSYAAAAPDNTYSFSLGLTSANAPAALVYGTLVNPASQPTGNTTPYAKGAQLVSSQTFGAVPEPSAALLGALGAFGLLRRRRI